MFLEPPLTDACPPLAVLLAPPLTLGERASPSCWADGSGLTSANRRGPLEVRRASVLAVRQETSVPSSNS